MRDSALNAVRRSADLERLAGGARVDLLVRCADGAELAGAAVAADAAARGLSVCLLMAGDLGGPPVPPPPLPAVRGAAVLRELLDLYPVEPIPRLIPLYGNGSGRLLTRLRLADAARLAAGVPPVVLPRARRVPAAEVVALEPSVRRPGLRGGLLSFDVWLPDSGRLVVALARTAAAAGAAVLTRVRAAAPGPSGAAATDLLTGAEFTVRARAVLDVVAGPGRRHAVVRSGVARCAMPWATPLGGGLAVAEAGEGIREFTVPTGAHRVSAGSGVTELVAGSPFGFRRAAQDAVTATGLAPGAAPLPLHGAVRRDRMSTVDAPRGWVTRYGGDAPRVGAPATVDPALAAALYEGSEVTAAEVVWAVRNELALTADDVLHRRLPPWLSADDIASARPAAARLVDRALAGLDS